MKHIQKIMGAFSQRFGELPLKEGQSKLAVIRSWERALGIYAEGDLISASRQWSDTAKYPRWPEVGELLDMLKGWGCKPVVMTGDNRPQHVIKAEGEAGVWYRWLIDQPNPAFAITNSLVLGQILEDIYPRTSEERVPLSFSYKLTSAFLHGILPAQWEERRDAYIENHLRMKALHKEACERFGVARVNESKGAWVNWPSAQQ